MAKSARKPSKKPAGKKAGKKSAASKPRTKSAKAKPARKPAAKPKSKVVAKSRPSEKIASRPKALKPAGAKAAGGKIAKSALSETIKVGKSQVKQDAGVYMPSDNEPFMNERHKEYFRRKLLSWKEEILRESRETLTALQTENENHPDLADRASSETDRAIELRARDRQRKLIAKIDAALIRIDDGTYGYCEETGEPISLKRLDARPIATLSIEAQERHERRERVYRDD